MRRYRLALLAGSLAVLAACTSTPAMTDPPTPIASTVAALLPITSVCSLVSDEEVASAFDVTGWHGQNLGPINGNPTDFRCFFKGPGYEFDVRTAVLSSNLVSAQDAMRVETSSMSLPAPEDVVDVGDLAEFPHSADALFPLGLIAVKRSGDGWRSLRMAGYYTPASTGERTVLPRDAIIQLARKTIERM